MKKYLKKGLSLLLALVLVMGFIPETVFAGAETVASQSELPTSIDGLSIAYPYNTENIELTQTPVSRFDALTFESARNEVESAQMILTPNFKVDSFELTMNGLTNEKGNIIPGWAFEVYVQHYVPVSGAGNAANYNKFETQDSWLLNKQYSDYLYHPRAGKSAANGTYPNALIPQEAAIAAGENTISAGNNGGIWINLNVQDAAPGTYTGSAVLTVNGTQMQIPVSVRIYDVALSDTVHSIFSTGIWWDQLEAGEGYVTQALADSYYNYLIDKRISPWSRWNYWYTTDGLVSNVVSMAGDSRIPGYLLYYTNNDREVDRASVVTTLKALINKNIELVQGGSSIDLFKKAYFYFTNLDEPAGGSSAPTYAQVQAAINVLDSVKTELAPMLDAYPVLKESFLDIKNIVTGPNPTDDYLLIDGCPDYSGSSALTSTYDSVIYCPQFQNMQTAQQRALYANDEEVWWYGCCHPVAPYPTYHYNNPLISSRALGFMMYEYGISGMVYSSVNYWGAYSGNTIELYDYWNGYQSGTPGDQMLVYPGSDYGINGPIGSLRLETIRESSEDYEYLYLLGQFGGNTSTYTAGLYDGAIVTGVYDGHAVDPDGDGNTDANVLYHTRRIALLSKLEELNVASNGATNIAPGQEGFIRGTAFNAGKDTLYNIEDGNWKTISFDYKTEGTGELAVIFRGSAWGSKFYGDFRLNQNGEKMDYPGITTEKLDDGYIHVTFDIDALNRTGCMDNLNAIPVDIGYIDIFGTWTTVNGYIDNIQLSADAPESKPEEVIRGKAFTAGKDTLYDIENGNWKTVSFEYKTEGTGELAVIFRGSAWGSKFYGDFRLNENGEKMDYPGITTEKLDDGYIHVTFDIDALNRTGCVDNLNAVPVDIGYIDIYGTWTTVNGYIDNIQLSAEPVEPEPIVRGKTFTASKDTYFYLEEAGAWDVVSFDYKLDGSGELAPILRGSTWTSYYGDFRLNENGEKIDYAGITTEKLDDGYIHVTFDIAQLNRTLCVDNRNGAPADIALIDIFGLWTTANGYIDNIQVSKTEAVVRGNPFTAGKDTFFYLDEAGDWDTVSFEYKTEGTGELAVIMRGSKWSTFYGDFRLTESGEKVDYAGITTEMLDDGYIRVTFDIDALQRTGCVNNRNGAPVDIKLLDIYNWTTVNGYIDNIQYSAHAHGYEAVVTAPTCMEVGYTTYTCSCGDSYKDNETAALGHNYEDMVTAPTPETQGYTTHTCTRCGDIIVDSYTDYVPTESYMKLEGDMCVSLSLNKDLYIDLNGHNLTGTINVNGFKLYGIDSATNKYTTENMGYFSCVDKEGNAVVPESNHKSNVTGAIRRYMTIFTDDGYTFHRFHIGITHLNLKPSVTGVGYKAVFYGDDMVKAQLDATNGFGYKMWLEGGTPASIGKGRDAYSSGKVVTLRLNNFDAENYGETPVHASVWIKLANGTYIESAQSSLTLKNIVETINDNYTIYNEVQLKGVRAMIERNPAIQNWRVENLWQAPRGKAFTAGKDTYYDIEDGNWTKVSFDYKTNGAGELGVIFRGSAWGAKFYGDFRLNENGEKVDYPGITTEKLDDGYIHVTFVVLKLNRTGCVDNLNAVPADIGLIDIYGAMTSVNGYIDNIQLSSEPVETEPVVRGKPFTAAKDTYFYLDEADAWDVVSFEYKTDGAGELAPILRGTKWSTYYGDFRLNENGEKIDYPGITTEKLDDGYIRVTFDIAQLNRTLCVDNRNGAPVDIKLIDIFGTWTTVNGYIDNIQVSKKEVIRGKTFTAGKDNYFSLDKAGDYSKLSFDYKLTGSGELAAIIRGTKWSTFYGDFRLTENGEKVDYAGITTEKLSDGYIRVTFDIDALQRTACVNNRDKAPVDLSLIDIYQWTTVDGYIDNIQYS